MLNPRPALEIDPFAALRSKEFARLDESGVAYLDYAASGLYGASQAKAFAERLSMGVFGNPHSEHGPSRATERDMAEARAATLAFFDADPDLYEVCFTANTTAAIKLVAESYSFGPSRGLILTADNHNSVNGVREFARAAGAPVHVLPLTDDLRLDAPAERLAAFAREGAGLLAFPAQSNFSGVKHDLALVQAARALGFDVLLDAAGVGPAGGISLGDTPADFVAFSFYKLFGLPTGVGALVARKDALARLRRPWFAGGAVDFVSVEHDRHQLTPGHAGFEDGTPNFLAASAVTTGFSFIGDIAPRILEGRLHDLTSYTLNALQALTHADGAPAVQIYGPASMSDRGGTAAFNLLDRHGATIPYGAVETRARAQKVAIRGGCFCNPGAAERAFGFAGMNTAQAFDAVRRAFSISSFQAALGGSATVGALRLSVGPPTTWRDLDLAVELCASFSELG